MTTPNRPPKRVDPALIPIIEGTDLIAASAAAMQAAKAVEEQPTNIVVEVYDNFWNPLGFSGGYIQTQVSFPRLKLPSGRMVLKGSDPLAQTVLNCSTTLVPVTVQVESLRWAGWVEVAEDKINEDGSQTVECQLAGLATMLDRITVWPEPGLPIEIQPSEAIFIGPGITCLKTMVAENAGRIQLSFVDLFNTINTIGSLDINLQAWFDNSGIVGETGNEWEYVPVFVPPWDPNEDTSDWIFFHGRMDTCWKLMQQQLQDNGWYASLDVFLPGDPQPVPGTTLNVATYLFNVKDFSGITGPAAGFFAGLEKEVVNITGALLGTSVIGPIENSGQVPPGSDIVIAPEFGINFQDPYVIFNADTNDSGLISLNVAQHAPQAFQVILGGQSPVWLSAALNATMSYWIDIATTLIGITGIPDDLLNGILDNTFLAFELFLNTTIQQQVGPYCPPEKFFPTQSTYDIDMVFAAIDALWTVRGYPAMQAQFIQGMPYKVGRDVMPGGMGSVIRRNVLYTDFFDDIVIVDDNTDFAKVTVQIGDGQREDPPGLIYQRQLVGLEEDINLILLAPPGGS